MEDRRRSAIIGAAALLVIFGAIYVLALYLSGTFKSGFKVSATFSRAGQLLRNGSDVKERGVLVGAVTGIEVERATGRAHVTMRLFKDQHIPSNVHAAIRAKTLFGEKFIALEIPSPASTTKLAEGSEIPQSRTTPPIEVETILEKGVPILDAVDPEAFGASLHALAQGFTGNEDGLRRATIQSEKLLTETERTLPNLERNLVHLKHFAAALDASDSALLDALDGLAAVGEVIDRNPDDFHQTVAGLVPLARDLGDVLTNRQKDLGDLAGQGRAVLDQVATREAKLPALVRSLDGFLGVWVLDLSDGPNWRIAVTDPPIPLGTPYAPGEAPQPRKAAIFTPTHGTSTVGDLIRILTAPVGKDVSGAVGRFDPLLGVWR